MTEINKQVTRAKRRLMTFRFFQILTWSVFAGLLVAVIGMAIPKIWHLSFLSDQKQQDIWQFSWIIGGAVFGLLVACVWTWINRASRLEVAVEIDKRFGLKERLSSALAITPEEAETNVGRALVEDAEQKAEGIDVRDQFQMRPTWRACLPLAPILILTVLIFVPNAEKKAVAIEPEKVDRKRVEVAIKEFKEKVAEKRKQLAAKGLKDADPNLKSLEKQFDKLLGEKDDSKKNTLVKLNNIKKQLEERRKELGGSNKELKESLNRLKDMGKSSQADKLANAMANGDMDQAKKAIKELADKLKAGKLSEIEKKKLAKDLEELANELQKIADKHEKAKKKLEDQIKKALEKGDLDKAAQLQQQLDEKKAQDKQQEKMKKMAEQLKKCANCMKQGGNSDPKQGQGGKQQPNGNSDQQSQAMKQAGESLEDLAEQIEDLKNQMDEMGALEDLEEMAEEIKNAMNQQGGMGEGDKPRMADNAKGKGPGGGKRDLEEENVGNFRSQVRGKLQRGETVVTGDADGKNITGRTVSETRELVRSSMSKDTDPTENQKMSRSQRDHASQYFRALREND